MASASINRSITILDTGASHGLRTAYQDWATDTDGARLKSTDFTALENPRPSTSTDRESTSAAAEKNNYGGHHRTDKQSEEKQACKELRV